MLEIKLHLTMFNLTELALSLRDGLLLKMWRDSKIRKLKLSLVESIILKLSRDMGASHDCSQCSRIDE